METFLIKVAQLIAALALLVVVHEFGHYIFARIFGIKVEKFYLFFNPWFSLFKWKPRPPKNRKYNSDGTPKASWRDTEYGIGWIPLGGYCKIAGMIDESMDKEQMAQPPKSDEFRSRPAYQRLLVMTGGVFFNFILAIIIYIGIAIKWGDDFIPYKNIEYGMNYSEAAKNAGYQDGDIILSADGESYNFPHNQLEIVSAKNVKVNRHGQEITIHNPHNFPLELEKGFFNSDFPIRFPVYIDKFAPGSAAEKAGMLEGDHIIAVGDTEIETFDQLRPTLDRYASTEVPVTFVRGNDTLILNVTPDSEGLIGFQPKAPTDIFEVEHKSYNLFTAIPHGIVGGSQQLVSYVSSLKYLFTKKGAQQIGGFGAIGNLFPAKWNWRTFWEMAAFLSIILAFMNILPIPALDGGHVMFLLWEVVTRRKPSDKFLEYAQMAGMCFLLILLLYANGNDIYRFIFK